MSFDSIFLCFLYFYYQLVAACGCMIVRCLIYSLVFMWAIQTEELLRSDKEVISNPYSSVCFIKHLRITNCVGLEPFILTIYHNDVSSYNIFSILVSVFRCNVSRHALCDVAIGPECASVAVQPMSRHWASMSRHWLDVATYCNTPKYTLVFFNMFRVPYRYNLNFS